MTALNALPDRAGAGRAGETDTRGVDFSADLVPIADTIASITSVTIVRRDGVTIGANDLTITPAGAPAPWMSAVAYGPVVTSAGLFVNWWQKSGATIAATASVDYKITVTAVTTNGRILIRDCYQLIKSELG